MSNYIGEIPGMRWNPQTNAYENASLSTGTAPPATPVELPTTSLDQTFMNESVPAPAPTDISGGGGGILAPPTQDLASSPEWLAFLNQLGLEKDQFTSDIQRQRGVASNLAGQQAADITAQGPEQRRGITGGLETRGMQSSGQLIRSLANQRASEGRAQGQVQAGLTGTLSGLESSLAQKLMDLNSRQAQQELALRATGTYT